MTEFLRPRELQTLRYLARGYPPKTITEFLGVSRVATVHVYTSRAVKRLGVRTSYEAVALVAVQDYRERRGKRRRRNS